MIFTVVTVEKLISTHVEHWLKKKKMLLLLCVLLHLIIQHTCIYSICLSIIADMLLQEHRVRLVVALAIPTLLCMEVAC